jgi:RNA polymerase sigma-70 factor (ECF subfamily)
MLGMEGLLKAELAAIASASPPNLRHLVDAHFDFIARSLRRLGVVETDVDDAVQKVFLIAARKLDAIAAEHAKSFLFATALRVASETRRARRRREAGETAAAEAFAPCSESPEDLATTHQARALLDEILDAMPIEVRTVFTLFELEEMTMAAIADLVALPRGTVASRLRRGREIFHAEAKRLRARHAQVGIKP